MTVILYLDVFLAVNLLMNLVLLCLVNVVLKLCGKKRRIFAAGLFGAIAACVLVVAAAGYAENLQSKGVGRALHELLRLILTGTVFVGMLRIAFGKRKPGEWIRTGIMMGLITSAAGGWFEAAVSGETLRFYSFLFCAAGVYCAGKAALLFLRQKEKLDQHLYEAVLYYRGKEMHVTALADTGNRLYEPYGHQPVHVITKEAAERLCSTLDHIIYIPFSAVGTERGMLPGIRIDAMELKKEGVLIRRRELPWLAISCQPLSVSHQYEMLLHGEEE